MHLSYSAYLRSTTKIECLHNAVLDWQLFLSYFIHFEIREYIRYAIQFNYFLFHLLLLYYLEYNENKQNKLNTISVILFDPVAFEFYIIATHEN